MYRDGVSPGAACLDNMGMKAPAPAATRAVGRCNGGRRMGPCGALLRSKVPRLLREGGRMRMWMVM